MRRKTGRTVEERADRIAAKLRRAAREGVAPFGADAHRFRVKPRLPDAQVARFEARFGVRLPAGYRAFLTRVGDGPAGPAYGLSPLARTADKGTPADFLKTPFRHRAYYNPVGDPYWDRLWERVERGEVPEADAHRQATYRHAGTLGLCHEGCGMYHILVVTGPTRGSMWIMDECNDGGYLPLRVDFLGWYERWLDDALAGGDGNWWSRAGADG